MSCRRRTDPWRSTKKSLASFRVPGHTRKGSGTTASGTCSRSCSRSESTSRRAARSARRFAWPAGDGDNVRGAGYSISEGGSDLPRDTAYALFDNEVAPGGYFAITPGIGFHSMYSVSWSELDFDRLLARTENAFDLPWIREIVGSG